MSRCDLMILILTVFVKVIAETTDFSNPAMGSSIPVYHTSVSNEEYIRHIHSIINAYRSGVMGGRLVIETNALIDTKYRTLKRNADLINSLLYLPKGMDEAGR